jgi:hypothetical protein
MTDEVVIEVEGEIPQPSNPSMKRVGKRVTDLSLEEKEVIANDIKNGIEYEDVDCTFYKNGKFRVVNKKKGAVKTILTEAPEKPEKTVKLTDTQFLIQELMRMNETMITEKNKRKKLKNRFNEMYNTVNYIEDEEVEKPIQEKIEEKVEEPVQEQIIIPPAPQPARRLTAREIILSKNKS